MAATIVSVLEESFDLVKKNYFKILLFYIFASLVFVVILGIIVAIIFALGSITAAASFTPGVYAAIFTFLVVLAVVFLVEPIWIGTYYSMALQSLKGRVSLTEAFNQAIKRYVPLLWTIALEAIIIVVIDAVIFSPIIIPALNVLNTYHVAGSMGAQSVTSSILALVMVGLVLLLIYLIVSAILAPLLYEAVPLVMLEGTSGTKAIRESIDIGKKNFWSLLLLVVGVAVICVALSFVVQVFSLILKFSSLLLGSVVQLILLALIGAFTSAWTAFLPVIFYRDYVKKPKPQKQTSRRKKKL